MSTVSCQFPHDPVPVNACDGDGADFIVQVLPQCVELHIVGGVSGVEFSVFFFKLPRRAERVLQSEAPLVHRFAENRARVRSQSLGNARIRRELSMSGVSRENIDRAIEQIEEPEELRALRVWKRRFSELPEDRKERDRQVRYLLYRGFSMSSVSRVLRGEVSEPDDEEGF